MEKGLERATGEEALGTKPRSHQQAVPPPSSVGQEPGSSHRDYPPPLPAKPGSPATPFPSPPCSLQELAQPQSLGLSDASCTPRSRIPDPQHANSTPGIFHREQTHGNGGWRAETDDTPPTAAKLVAMSQFAREVFKNAENSQGTEFPALSA